MSKIKFINHYDENKTYSYDERIKLLRKQNKITQDELANALGITAQAISRWENCTGDPDIDLLKALFFHRF